MRVLQKWPYNHSIVYDEEDQMCHTFGLVCLTYEKHPPTPRRLNHARSLEIEQNHYKQLGIGMIGRALSMALISYNGINYRSHLWLWPKLTSIM